MIKKIKRRISKWLNPYNNSNFNLKCYTERKTNYSLLDMVIDLENRIIKLEDENLSLTNELYRLENSLESRIDLITSECKFKTEFN